MRRSVIQAVACCTLQHARYLLEGCYDKKWRCGKAGARASEADTASPRQRNRTHSADERQSNASPGAVSAVERATQLNEGGCMQAFAHCKRGCEPNLGGARARGRQWRSGCRHACRHALCIPPRWNSHFWKVHAMGADVVPNAFPRSGGISWGILVVLGGRRERAMQAPVHVR